MEGDLISIIPNVKPTLMLIGGAAKIDYILIVKKLKVK